MDRDVTANVTAKGQVTLPKAVREAAGIRPGDRVTVRVRPEGGGDCRGRGGCEERRGLFEWSQRHEPPSAIPRIVFNRGRHANDPRRGLNFVGANILIDIAKDYPAWGWRRGPRDRRLPCSRPSRAPCAAGRDCP